MYFHVETLGRTCTESPQRDTQGGSDLIGLEPTDELIDRQCIRNPIWNGLTYGTDARSKDGEKKGRDCDVITAGQAFKRKPWTALGSKQRGPRPTRGR